MCYQWIWELRTLYFTYKYQPYLFTYIYIHTYVYVYQPVRASLVAQTVKNLPTMQETQLWSLSQEDSLEKRMATHSSIHAWRIPWTEKPGGYSPWGHRVGHDWATSTLSAYYWCFTSDYQHIHIYINDIIYY